MQKTSVFPMELRKFLFKVAAFVLVFVMADLLVNQMYIFVVESHSYLFRTEAQFQEYKDDTNILIVGDSHPMSAVNPLYIEESFNLTAQGENTFETYYRLKYYLEKENLDVQLVVLPFDLHTFSSYRVDRFRTSEYWRKYIDYIELGLYKHDLMTFVGYAVRANFAYMGGIRDSLDVIKINDGFMQGESPIVRGHVIRDNYFYRLPHPYVSARAKVKEHLKGMVVIHPEAVDYFQRILDMLEAHHIKTVLVGYPITREYFLAASEVMDTEAYLRDINDMLKGRSVDYTVLDYHDLYWDTPEYFFNSDHLNGEGAIEFTKVLKQDLDAQGFLP